MDELKNYLKEGLIYRMFNEMNNYDEYARSIAE